MIIMRTLCLNGMGNIESAATHMLQKKLRRRNNAVIKLMLFGYQIVLSCPTFLDEGLSLVLTSNISFISLLLLKLSGQNIKTSSMT